MTVFSRVGSDGNYAAPAQGRAVQNVVVGSVGEVRDTFFCWALGVDGKLIPARAKHALYAVLESLPPEHAVTKLTNTAGRADALFESQIMVLAQHLHMMASDLGLSIGELKPKFPAPPANADGEEAAAAAASPSSEEAASAAVLLWTTLNTMWQADSMAKCAQRADAAQKAAVVTAVPSWSGAERLENAVTGMAATLTSFMSARPAPGSAYRRR